MLLKVVCTSFDKNGFIVLYFSAV